MPLFLQALPLSLGTLWRYLLLLPFLTALSVAAALPAIYIPIIGLIIPGVISVFCTLAGLRCALSARGHYSELDLGRLLGASFWYLLLGIVAGIVFAVLIFALGQADALVGGGSAAENSGSEANGGLVEVSALVLGLVYLLGVCAMAVPMTAAAATSLSRGAQTDLFWGFGSGTVSLVIVSVLGFLCNGALLLASPDTIALYLMLQGDVTELGQRIAEFPDAETVIPVAIGSIVLAIWSTCWFFATAVLAWERARANQTASRRTTAAVPRVSADDLRALREARMPGREDR